MSQVPLFPKFKKLEITDKPHLEKIIRSHPPYSDYNFVSLFSWDTKGKAQISRLHDNLAILFNDYVTGDEFYSFLGTKKADESAHALLDLAKRRKVTTNLLLIPEVTIKSFQKPGTFDIVEDRDSFDYIFLAEEMSSLAGPKYNKKRNKVSKFIRSYPGVEMKVINLSDKKHHTKLLRVFSQWEKAKGRDSKETASELTAVKRLLAHSHFLPEVICLGIFHKGQLVGFSLTEVLHDNHGIFHFVKADPTYAGIFEFIYKLTAQHHVKQGVKYLSREQDLGIEHLRVAKLSWSPSHFLKKYTVSLKSGA